jgi:uncharacterized membrane protein
MSIVSNYYKKIKEKERQMTKLELMRKQNKTLKRERWIKCAIWMIPVALLAPVMVRIVIMIFKDPGFWRIIKSIVIIALWVLFGLRQWAKSGEYYHDKKHRI